MRVLSCSIFISVSVSFERHFHCTSMKQYTPIENAELNAKETSSALKKLLFFSLLIIVAPISCYFCSKLILFEWLLGMTSMNSYFYSAITSIVVLHVVLAMFVYVAWSDNLKVSTYKTD